VSIGYFETEEANAKDMLIYYKEEDIIKFGAVGFEIKVV